MHPQAIPSIDISALFAAGSGARELTDAAIARSASECGFLLVTGLPATVPLGAAARAALLRVFALPERDRQRLWRRKFEPRNPNVYRGWFPLQPGNLTGKEGMDIGPDIAHGPELIDPADPLRGATPMPEEASLPGWRGQVAAYYLAMESVARVLMQSIARGLGLEEQFFDAAFRHGLSTLRLLRYPVRTLADLNACKDPQLWVERGASRLHVVGAAHTDSGFMTLLAQDKVAGLEARGADGAWVEVPPREDSCVVNFGQVLEAWSAGRIKATEHRVLGTGQQRYSIPFFYEARADAEISPLPGQAGRFEPFLYGDYLWARIVSFVEFRGMAAERPPRRGGALQLNSGGRL